MAHFVIEHANASAITIVDSSPQLSDCVIRNNTTAGRGAGISASVAIGDLTISRCVIAGNDALGSGGGLNLEMGTGTAVLEDLTVHGNHSGAPAAAGSGRGEGGGVRLSGNSIVRRSVIADNDALSRGGSAPTAFGRGLSLRGAAAVHRLENVIVSGNRANGAGTGFSSTGEKAFGGGINSDAATLSIRNSIVACNRASSGGSGIGIASEGGGVQVAAGTAEVTNAVIIQNTTRRAGGTRGGLRVAAAATAVVRNSVLYSNEDGLEQIGGTPTVSYSIVQNGFAGSGNLDVNPGFVSDLCPDDPASAVDDEQLAADLRLVPGTGSVDAGSPEASDNDLCFPPSLGASRNDIGAFGGPGACGWTSNAVPPSTTTTSSTTVVSTTTTSTALGSPTTTTTSSTLPAGCEPGAPGGTPCDNGNSLPGDTCEAGRCVDAVCRGATDGSSCSDANACTEGDACQDGVCAAGVEPCRVDLPCTARASQACNINVLCTGPCQVTISVAVRGRPRARCRAVLVQVTTALGDGRTGRPRRAAERGRDGSLRWPRVGSMRAARWLSASSSTRSAESSSGASRVEASSPRRPRSRFVNRNPTVERLGCCRG